MNYEVLKDFKKVSDVPQELITEYEGKIPQDIISLWKEYGFGSFFNDYFGTNVILGILKLLLNKFSKL